MTVKKTAILLVLLVVGTLTTTVLRPNNEVAAQSSCEGMSYNTPIFASGSASDTYRLFGTLSVNQVLASSAAAAVSQSATSQCMDDAAEQYGPEAQNCAEICSSASTPQETCAGTASLHGSCQTSCSASARHTYTKIRGDRFGWTTGKIGCSSNGRFTVACVCRGTSTAH